MTPTKAEIDAGVVEAKKLVAQYVPAFLQGQINDDEIAQGVTAILTAALEAGDAA
jgi:hypothetical protein